MIFKFIKSLFKRKEKLTEIQYDDIHELNYEYISAIIRIRDWPITFVLTSLIKEKDVDRVMNILLRIGVTSNRVKIIDQNIKIDYYTPTIFKQNHKNLEIVNKMNHHLYIESQELCRIYNLRPIPPPLKWMLG